MTFHSTDKSALALGARAGLQRVLGLPTPALFAGAFCRRNIVGPESLKADYRAVAVRALKHCALPRTQQFTDPGDHDAIDSGLIGRQRWLSTLRHVVVAAGLHVPNLKFN